MLPTIEKSERFQLEYKTYQEKISAVQDENTKAEMAGLLKELLFAVRSLDDQHSDFLLGKNFTTPVSGMRERIAELRKTLNKKILSASKRRTQAD